MWREACQNHLFYETMSDAILAFYTQKQQKDDVLFIQGDYLLLELFYGWATQFLIFSRRNYFYVSLCKSVLLVEERLSHILSY